MRVVARIAISSVLSVGLVALALAVTIYSFRGAVAAHHSALADLRQSNAVAEAEGYLWRERESMNEYLLTHETMNLEEVRDLRREVRATLVPVGRGNADEAELVGIVLAANASFIAAFSSNVHPSYQSAKGLAELIGALNGGEELALAPLHKLEAAKVADARASDAQAEARSVRALLAGVAAGALAIGAGLLFALYAIRLVRRVAHQNDELRQLDQMKDDFVNTVTHELRTPLASIIGYLEMLLEGDVSDEQTGFLAVIRKNSNRLLRLVGDLQFVENLRTTIMIETVAVELSSLVESAVENARLTSDRDLQLTLGTASLVEVEGDPDRLTQLVENLLSNALKFTAPGDRIDVCLTVRDGSARLEISDTGLGIPAHDVDRVFERFYRSAAANELAIQGSGLGLAIVAAIVEAHGGSIEVESELGVGTTFTVVLPTVAGEQRLAA